MSKANDRFYNDLINDIEDIANMDFSNLPDDSLDDFLEPFKTNEDFSDTLTSSVSSDSYRQSSSESSSQSNVGSTSQIVSRSITLSYNTQSIFERLQMVEQPYQRSKLRYRTDYIRDKRRLGVLGNKNKKSNLKGPAIHISQCYLNPNNEYYIRISLVTVKYSKTNLHYFHPYELEHPKNEQFNDRGNNSVWFSIEQTDFVTGIKSFPLLRIVKKKIFHVQKLDHYPVFDCDNQISQNTSLPAVSPSKEIDIIKEYDLGRSQLAFTLGEKVMINGQPSMVLYTNTTVFSDIMVETEERQSVTETDTESSGEKPTSSSLNHYIYKYAPRSGVVGNEDEILIFLRTRLERKRYGDLQVIFECNTSQGHWSQPVNDVDIKDRMISFKIPNFPYPITNTTTIDIILRQDNRSLGVLEYSFLPPRL